MDLKERIAAQLEDARRRSLHLLAPVPERDLVRQHSPLMSPLVWDLSHIGNYEETWLLRELTGERLVGDSFDALFDPIVNPRRVRSTLELPGPGASREYVGAVREHVLTTLWRADLDGGGALLERGYVYGMVVQHEHQHDETMLQTLNLRDAEYSVARVSPPSPGPVEPEEVFVDAGPFVMGTDEYAWAYDNERPAHVVDLPAFWIDAAPVSNRSYLAFVEAGGYHERAWWTPEGWRWCNEAQLRHPEFWRREPSGTWTVRRLGLPVPLPLDEPVQHVCWYEADAFARWAGKRLPSEAEWEKAASWDPKTRRKRLLPWGEDRSVEGRANLAQNLLGPASLGTYPEGRSWYGCHHMLGDVWEWTASDFRPYPGFVAFPYREYSEVHFGSEYKVLRGGSWATHPSVARTTFRNWDYPIRRQLFAGFRCARDA